MQIMVYALILYLWLYSDFEKANLWLWKSQPVQPIYQLSIFITSFVPLFLLLLISSHLISAFSDLTITEAGVYDPHSSLDPSLTSGIEA